MIVSIEAITALNNRNRNRMHSQTHLPALSSVAHLVFIADLSTALETWGKVQSHTRIARSFATISSSSVMKSTSSQSSTISFMYSGDIILELNGMDMDLIGDECCVWCMPVSKCFRDAVGVAQFR